MESQYVVIRVWLLSVSIPALRFIRAVACFISLLLSRIPLYGYFTFGLSVHKSRDSRTFTGFYSVNNAAMSVHIQAFVVPMCLFLLGRQIPRRTAGSRAQALFNFLRNGETALQSSGLISHSPQQRRSIPVSPHP